MKNTKLKEAMHSWLTIALWCSGIAFGICVASEDVALTFMAGALSIIVSVTLEAFQ